MSATALGSLLPALLTQAQSPPCPAVFDGVSTLRCDTDIASGRDHVLIIENDEIRTFSKCAVTLFGPTLIDGPTGFFSSAPLEKLGDPEVHFDPVNKRYWAIAQDPGSPTEPAPIGVYLAVSAS